MAKIVFGISVGVVYGASAAPAFADMFTGGAVLQRDTEVTVWGTNAGASSVTLSVDGSHVADATVEDGNWTARFKAPSASFGNKLTASDEGGSTSVNVSFGDVLLCSGQSNMDMPVANKPGGFQADNGTAEAAASMRYTGGIWLWKQVESKYRNLNTWSPVSPETLASAHSAVCWYTGKNLFDRLGGKVPVGLLQASVGGSPIEYWISKASIQKCETDQPACDPQLPDATFYEDQIVSLQPYTVGAIIWDQAERDLKCNHVEKYPCMLRELATSWRTAFDSEAAPFVVVQLPDYFDPKDPGAEGVPGYASTAEGLLAMRLAQETALKGLEKVALVPTYDQSCNNLAFPEDCPFGSVHNVHKQLIGKRIAAQLDHLMHGIAEVVDGPQAQEASAVKVNGVNSTSAGFSVTIKFAGGTSPFVLQPTRNCTDCCEGKFGAQAKGDFDASHDGKSWVLGTYARMKGDDSVVFHVGMESKPAFVRYTGGSNFTQCALFNKEALPAFPFQMTIHGDEHDRATKDTLIV